MDRMRYKRWDGQSIENRIVHSVSSKDIKHSRGGGGVYREPRSFVSLGMTGEGLRPNRYAMRHALCAMRDNYASSSEMSLFRSWLAGSWQTGNLSPCARLPVVGMARFGNPGGHCDAEVSAKGVDIGFVHSAQFSKSLIGFIPSSEFQAGG